MTNEVHITGFFTIDEMSSAVEMGAILKPLKGGQKDLKFENQKIYDRWINIQKEKYPSRWDQSITIKPK